MKGQMKSAWVLGLVVLGVGCSKEKEPPAEKRIQSENSIVLHTGPTALQVQPFVGKKVRVTPIEEPFPYRLRTIFLTLDRGRWSLQVAPDGAATATRHDYPVAMGRAPADTFHFPTVRQLLVKKANWGTETDKGDLEFYLWFGQGNPSSPLVRLNGKTSDELLKLFQQKLGAFRWDDPDPAAMLRFDLTNKANASMPKGITGRVMGHENKRGNLEYEGRHIPASIEKTRGK